jgi:hypothetical protein
MKRNAGFTLVEVLVAAGASSVVIGILFGLLSASGRWLKTAAAPMVPWEAAHHMLTGAGIVLADAKDYSIAADGHSIAFTAGGRAGSLAYSGGQLVLTLGPTREVLGSPKGFTVEDYTLPGMTGGMLRLSLQVLADPGSHQVRWVTQTVRVTSVAERFNASRLTAPWAGDMVDI